MQISAPKDFEMDCADKSLHLHEVLLDLSEFQHRSDCKRGSKIKDPTCKNQRMLKSHHDIRILKLYSKKYEMRKWTGTVIVGCFICP